MAKELLQAYLAMGAFGSHLVEGEGSSLVGFSRQSSGGSYSETWPINLPKNS